MSCGPAPLSDPGTSEVFGGAFLLSCLTDNQRFVVLSQDKGEEGGME